METKNYMKATHEIPNMRFVFLVARTNGVEETYKVVSSVVRFKAYVPLTQNGNNSFSSGYEKVDTHTRSKVLKDGSLNYYTGILNPIKNAYINVKYFNKYGVEISKTEYEKINPPKPHKDIEWYSKKVEDIISITYGGKVYR